MTDRLLIETFTLLVYLVEPMLPVLADVAILLSLLVIVVCWCLLDTKLHIILLASTSNTRFK